DLRASARGSVVFGSLFVQTAPRRLHSSLILVGGRLLGFFLRFASRQFGRLHLPRSERSLSRRSADREQSKESDLGCHLKRDARWQSSRRARSAVIHVFLLLRMRQVVTRYVGRKGKIQWRMEIIYASMTYTQPSSRRQAPQLRSYKR